MNAMNSQTAFSSRLTELSGGPIVNSADPSDQHVDLDGDTRWQLAQRIATSKSFAKSGFLLKFLLYVCERELTGRADEISEQQIGVHVFGRRPDYNPGEDNIVRSYARQLRQRLDLYFEEDGQQEKLRITIPRGGYVPVFFRNEVSAWSAVDFSNTEATASASTAQGKVLQPRPAIADVEPRLQRRRVPLYGVIAFVVICVALGWIGAERLLKQNDNSSHFLWAQLFDSKHLTYIVPADDGIVMFQNLTGHLVPLSEYVDRDYLSVKVPPSIDPSNMADLEAQRYTSVTDLNAALRFSSLPEGRSDHTIVRYARELHMQDLKDSNAILVGSSYSNPWVELFEKNLNFRFNYKATPNASFIRNSDPQAGELPNYQNDATAPSHQTYGVIALTHNLNRAGSVLIVEGLTMAGTQAAVDTVFDSRAMQPILEKARNTDGSLRPFEILIETRSFGSNSPQASIVATRIYSK
jgi:hypothetical protein